MSLGLPAARQKTILLHARVDAGLAQQFALSGNKAIARASCLCDTIDPSTQAYRTQRL